VVVPVPLVVVVAAVQPEIATGMVDDGQCDA
jgi:hypothetical protein